VSRFGPDPREFFAGVYNEPAPWDVGTAQPALVQLFDSIAPEGPVLDVGCGTGDLAIHLAQRELHVLGVDFVDAAITEAIARSASLDAEVRSRLSFRVADATKPSALERSSWGPPFGAVVDSGFLHLFDDFDRDAFAADLARALRPGGRYYMLGFAITFPGENLPRAVEEAELEGRFSDEAGWTILSCNPAVFQSRVGDVPAIAACIERSRDSRDDT
jgi:SAM-dependent methyltransferase